MVEPTGRVAAANSPASDHGPGHVVGHVEGVPPPRRLAAGDALGVVQPGRAPLGPRSSGSCRPRRACSTSRTPAPGRRGRGGSPSWWSFASGRRRFTTPTSSHVARTTRRPTTSVPITGRSAPRGRRPGVGVDVAAHGPPGRGGAAWPGGRCGDGARGPTTHEPSRCADRHAASTTDGVVGVPAGPREAVPERARRGAGAGLCGGATPSPTRAASAAPPQTAPTTTAASMPAGRSRAPPRWSWRSAGGDAISRATSCWCRGCRVRGRPGYLDRDARAPADLQEEAAPPGRFELRAGARCPTTAGRPSR